jgi:hypothetical protein
MEALSPNALVVELSAHPHIDALAGRVYARATKAADGRQRGFATPGASNGAEQVETEVPELTSEQADTAHGNPLELLGRGVRKPEERQLLGALLALGAAKQPPGAEDELAARLVWLATHTPCSAFGAIDPALGERADLVWDAVAKIADYPQLAAPDFGTAEALVAAVALRTSPSTRAGALAAELLKSNADPMISAVLGRSEPSAREAISSESADKSAAKSPEKGVLLTGELVAAPRGPVVTALLAFTLILPLIMVARLIGRYALAFRRPAAVGLSERGLELEYRSELLGRVLREKSVLVPLSNIASVTREHRYAQAGLYAGLLALVLGSYFGVGLLADGVRVPGGSLPLIGLAVLMIAGGLALDFLFSSVAVNARGRCRLVVVQRKGRALCVAELDPAQADALLASVAKRVITLPAAHPQRPAAA